MCVYKIQKFCGKVCLRPIKCMFNLKQQTNIFLTKFWNTQDARFHKMNSMEEVPKLPLWSLPIKLGREKCLFWWVQLHPCSFWLQKKFLKCFFWASAKLSPFLKCCKNSISCPQGKPQRREKYINKPSNSKPLTMLFPHVVGHSGHVSEKWIFQILLLCI